MEMPFDYLKPEVNRPDLYESRSTIQQSRGVTNTNKNVISTLAIIFISGLIFITLVAWADVLRSYIDTIYVDKIINRQAKSRLIFAIVITIISLLSSLIIGYFVLKYNK